MIFFKKKQMSFFFAYHFLFYWNPKKQKYKFHPLALLSIILTAICVFIPILILSITNGFQEFSLGKLSNFYPDYSIKLPKSIDRQNLVQYSKVQSYYEDFILIKSKKKENPSLLRSISLPDLKNLIERKEIKLIKGKIPQPGEILISDSLATNLGLSVTEQADVFMFLPSSAMPIRETKLKLSGTISFESASLDRTVSFIIPQTLESHFFLNENYINTIASSNKQDLEPLKGNNQILALQEFPIVKSMKQQYYLLLILVFSSSFIVFFSLYMNLKTNIYYNLYAIHILKILGLTIYTIINIFSLQSIMILFIGFLLGLTLCFMVIPYISQILKFIEYLCNYMLEILKNQFTQYKNIEPFNFLPTDIFYIQTIPIKMQLQDFIFVFLALTIGIIIINQLSYKWFRKSSALDTLKQKQGI